MTRYATRLLALATLLAATSTHALDLTVEVLNARPDKGKVNAALFNDEASWMKNALAEQRIPAGSSTVLVYRNLAPGLYALSLFQDENGNNRLDTNVIGLPTERYGFSRDAMGAMGAPGFGAAAVELKADTTLQITLR
jgi:uncharacterized protein (DUF2141 family)